MIDLHQPNMQPINNIEKNIVYSGSKQNVKMTMVNGKILYEDGAFFIGADAEEIYENPAHPYTKALFSAIPPVRPFEVKETIELKGEIPSPLNMPPGCPFGNRCPYCTEECKKAVPELKDMGNGHKVACVRYQNGEIQ